MLRIEKVSKIALTAIFLTGLALLAGCKEEDKKAEYVRPVRTEKIVDATAMESRTFPGKVKASQEVALAFRVPGQIESFDVKEGDHVKKGEIIARLDQRDYQTAVADLEAKLAGARSVMNEASLNYYRNKELLKSDTIAQSSFDSAKRAYETSVANVNSLEQELRRTKLNLQYTELRAPFSGHIAVKNVDNHEYVQAKEPIVQLEDISTVDIAIDVPENVWIKGTNGLISEFKATAVFETYPNKVFDLKLKEFQTKANPETQTYQVTFKMSNSKSINIHPGMTAEVNVFYSNLKGSGSIRIPVTSVTGGEGNSKYVWVLKDNKVSRKKVTLGNIVKDKYIVKSGLTLGDEIVVAGANYLTEGQIVKVLKGRIGSRR